MPHSALAALCMCALAQAWQCVRMDGSQAGVGGACLCALASTGGEGQLCLARMAVTGTIVARQDNRNPSNGTTWSLQAVEFVCMTMCCCAAPRLLARGGCGGAQCSVRRAAQWLSTLGIAAHYANCAIVCMLELDTVAGNAALGDSRFAHSSYCASASVLK